MALEAVDPESAGTDWFGAARWRHAVVSASPALLHGLRLTTSVCLALFIAFWFQLENPHWAGTSAAIVAQPALGASLRKGRFRAIGTIVGGCFIVLLTAVFPQDHAGFLLCLMLWAALCGYLATVLRNFAGYAAALAGYSAAIVFAGFIDNPQDVLLVSIWRVTEICIGIACAVIVHSLTDFGDARARLARTLSDLGRAIASGVVQTLQSEREDLRMRTSRRALIGRVIDLDITIDEAMGESSELRRRGDALRAVRESLFLALSAWRGLGNHLETIPVRRRVQLAQALRPPIAAMARRPWLSDPAAILDLSAANGRRVAEMATPDVSSRIAIGASARVLEALGTVAQGMCVVNRPSEPTSNVRRNVHAYVADPLPGMLNGLRVAVAVGAAELLWIATGWPHAPTMIVFTTVGVVLFGRQGDSAYPNSLEFAIGCALAAVLASVLLLAVLPATDGGFPALSLALAAVMLPLGALSAGTWHKALFLAAVTNLIPILAIQNEMDYDASRLFNIAVAVIAGTGTAVICFRLLPPLPPERRIRRLLKLSLQDLRALLGGRHSPSQDAWRDLLSTRFSAMPREATLDQDGALLATYAVGEAAIILLAAEPTSRGHDDLRRALQWLAQGKVTEARNGLLRFVAAQHASGAAVPATIIIDAMRRHPRFFSGAD